MDEIFSQKRGSRFGNRSVSFIDEPTCLFPENRQDIFSFLLIGAKFSFQGKSLKLSQVSDFKSFSLSFCRYDGEWAVEQQLKNPLAGDYGLVLKSKAKHAAISSRLKKPFTFTDDTLIVQYVINYQVSTLFQVTAFEIKIEHGD